LHKGCNLGSLCLNREPIRSIKIRTSFTDGKLKGWGGGEPCRPCEQYQG